MKLSEFKNYITERYNILKLNTINSWQIDTAYFSQGWGNIMSTVVWTLTYLVFLHAIFANVKTFAGYNHNEILLLTLVGQLTFYVVWSLSLENILEMIDGVNTGALDLILTKPMPSLFYVSLKRIYLAKMLRDGIPSISILALAVNWSELTLTFPNVIAAIIIFICGQFCLQAFMFVFSLIVFWQGKGAQALWISFEIVDSVNNIPFEGYPSRAKILLTSFFPIIFATAATASVLLGKSQPFLLLTLALIAAIVLTIFKTKLWNIALRNYSSASS